MLHRVFQDSYSQDIDDEGKAAVEEYSYFLHHPDHYWGHQCQIDVMLDFDPETVWQLLLETQHLGVWLRDGWGAEGDLALPAVFGRGQRISAKNSRLGPAFVLDCTVRTYSGEKILTIQRKFYEDHDPYYYTFIIKPHERFSTKLHITARRAGKVPTEWWAVFLQKIFKAKESYEKSSEPAKKELTASLNRAVKQFAYLCWDRTNYGPLARDAPGCWLTWTSTGDTIKFYQNKNGKLGPEINEYIKKGEHVGFVHPANANGSLDYWKENNYVTPGCGYVKQVLKRHGDRVEDEDRIILLANDKDTDLSEIQLWVHGLFKSESCGGFYLEKYVVEIGQSIKQGDVIVVFKNKRNGEIVSLVSKYCGSLLEKTMPVGQELFYHEYDVLAKMKVFRMTG